jgi:hypothetical protein
MVSTATKAGLKKLFQYNLAKRDNGVGISFCMLLGEILLFVLLYRQSEIPA